jgi:hypothetical protein
MWCKGPMRGWEGAPNVFLCHIYRNSLEYNVSVWCSTIVRRPAATSNRRFIIFPVSINVATSSFSSRRSRSAAVAIVVPVIVLGKVVLAFCTLHHVIARGPPRRCSCVVLEHGVSAEIQDEAPFLFLSFTMPRDLVALSLWSAETFFIRLIVVHIVILRVVIIYRPMVIHLVESVRTGLVIERLC